MATFESNNTGETGSVNIYGTGWVGQTFTPSIRHSVTSVNLKLYKSGSPGTITASIRATSGGVPIGADLASGTYNGDTLGSSPGAFVSIDLGSGTILDASTQYAICIRAPSGDISNRIVWRRSGDLYADGTRVNSNDSGGSWSFSGPSATQDMMFEELGTSVPVYPTDAITRVTSIIYRYNRGVFSTELGLGGVVSDFDIPVIADGPSKSYTSSIPLDEQPVSEPVPSLKELLDEGKVTPPPEDKPVLPDNVRTVEGAQRNLVAFYQAQLAFYTGQSQRQDITGEQRTAFFNQAIKYTRLLRGS